MTEKTKQALLNTFYWIVDRLGENSTWRGLFLVLSGFSSTWAMYLGDPKRALAIMTAGMTIVGIINIFRKEVKVDSINNSTTPNTEQKKD